MHRVAVTIQLGASAPDGDCPLGFAAATLPLHGTLGAISNVGCSAGSAHAQLTYMPAGRYVGADSFTYIARDPSGATSTAATVAITVKGSQPPVVSAESATTMQRVAVTIQLAASDPDGDCPLGFAAATLPPHGTLRAITKVGCSARRAHAQLTYMPAGRYVGADSFTYIARDPSGAASTAATVAITVKGSQPPVVSAESATTMQRVAVTIQLAARDL